MAFAAVGGLRGAKEAELAAASDPLTGTGIGFPNSVIARDGSIARGALSGSRYAALKHRLASYHGQSDDHAAYVLIKDPVCDVIMSAAYVWAADGGWQPGPSDA